MHSSLWFDDGLARCNPVHAVESSLPHLAFAADPAATASEALALLDLRGVRLGVRRDWMPAEYRLAEDRPGVVGLVVHRTHGGGFVLPLRAELGKAIDSSLPFTREGVLDVLARLVESAGLLALPERFAFGFSNPLGMGAGGNSMTVAAALAVLDLLGGRASDLLARACSFVEPTPDGRLAPVLGSGYKAEAFSREIGEASLVVCAPGCASAKLGNAWEVGDWTDLAQRLAGAGLLSLLEGALSRDEGQRVLDRMRWLVSGQRHERATALAARLDSRRA